MGACVARDVQNIDSQDHLLQKDGDGVSGAWCIAPVKEPGSGPFSFRVKFRRGARPDAECKVVRSLMELLWVSNPRLSLPPKVSSGGPRLPSSSQTVASNCVAALKALRVGNSDTILDFVVPVINIVLHAPCMECREVVWEQFVLDSARTDVALGHLFFWGLKAVESSPQAEIGVQIDARKRMYKVQGAICAKAQLKAALRQLEDANATLKRQKSLPKVPKTDPNTVSPLVDICQRLHYIGEEIVKVKDRGERLSVLQNLVEKEINQRCNDDTPVPAPMLAPHAGPSRASTAATSSILRVTKSEAKVLSSKARAPYLIVMEVEDSDSKNGDGTRRGGLLGCLCRSRNSQSGNKKALRPGPPKHWPPGEASPSSASSRNGATRPKGAFHDETWPEVVNRVRRQSEFGRRPGWNMIPLIVKSNADDVRQEELAYRLLKWFQRLFKRHCPRLWLQPFLIIATSHDGGVLEVVTNAISISDLKKSYGESWDSLRGYFQKAFTGSDRLGPDGEKSTSFRTATNNFIYSMAAYSVVCYVLAIRDRHNGNIMLDDEGHVIHVDFGFMLCGAPGGKALQKMGGFEHSAGFKLTNELVEVLGPLDGREFQVFRQAVMEGMLAVRSNTEELLSLLQLSMLGSENNLMNCFTHPRGYQEAVLEDVCERLGLPGGANGGAALTDQEFRSAVDRMIDESVDHWRSRLYDTYQYHFVGVH